MKREGCVRCGALAYWTVLGKGCEVLRSCVACGEEVHGIKHPVTGKFIPATPAQPDLSPDRARHPWRKEA